MLTVHDTGVTVHDIALVAAEQKTALIVLCVLAVVRPVRDSAAHDQALVLVVWRLVEGVSGV